MAVYDSFVILLAVIRLLPFHACIVNCDAAFQHEGPAAQTLSTSVVLEALRATGSMALRFRDYSLQYASGRLIFLGMLSAAVA
eukprot:2789718-Pleurochrysis_carterae.AAC.2